MDSPLLTLYLLILRHITTPLTNTSSSIPTKEMLGSGMVVLLIYQREGTLHLDSSAGAGCSAFTSNSLSRTTRLMQSCTVRTPLLCHLPQRSLHMAVRMQSRERTSQSPGKHFPPRLWQQEKIPNTNPLIRSNFHCKWSWVRTLISETMLNSIKVLPPTLPTFSCRQRLPTNATPFLSI